MMTILNQPLYLALVALDEKETTGRGNSSSEELLVFPVKSIKST